MPQIELYSPVGEEAPRATGIAPFPELGGSKIAFLFNGHVSVLPFWKNLEEEIKTRFEPSDTITVIKPNTFSPAGSSTIEDLSDVDLALVGVSAWGSCTSGSVRDGINLENKGVPAVVISHNVFGKAAQAQSVALGLPELRVIIYDQPKGKPDDVEGALFAKQVVDQLEVMVQESDL